MYGLALSIVASQTSAFLQPSGSHPGSIVSARSCQFKRDLPLYLSSDDSESKKIATSEKVEDIEQLPSKMGSSSTKPLEVNDEKTAKSSAIEDYIASLNLFNYITVVNDEVKPTPEKKAPKADIKPAVKLSDEKISDEVAKKDEIPETTNEVKVEEMKTDSTEAKDKVDIKEVTSLTEESKKEVEKSKEDQKKTEVLPKVAADSEKILESPKVGTEKTKITAKDEKILEIENVAKTETKTEIEVTVKSPEAFKDKEPTPKVEPIKVTKEEKVEIEEIKEKKSETEEIVEGKGSAEVDKNLSNFTQKLTSFFKNKGPSAVRDPNNDPSARVTDFTDYSGKSLNPLDKDEVDELVEQRGGVLNEVFFKEQFRKLEDNARKGVEKTDKEVTAESDKKGSLPFNFLSGIVPSKDEKKVISDEAEKIEKPKATKSPDSVVEKKSEPINFNIFSNMFNPPIFDDERAETSVPPAIEKKVVSTISKEESEPKQFTNPLAAILRKPTSDNDTEKISRKEEEKKLEPSMIANPFSGMFRKSSDVKKEEKVAQKIEKVEPEPIKNTQSEPLKVKNLFSKILSKSPAAEEKKEKTGAATVPITAIKPPSVERPIQARPPQPTKEPIKIGNPFSGMFAKPIFNEEKPKVIKNDVVVDAPPLKPLSKGKNEEKGNFITNIFSKAEKTEPKVVTPPPQAIKAVIPQKKDAPKQKVSENETMNSIFGMFSKPKAKETVSKTIAAPSAAIKSNKGPFSNVTAPKEAKKVPLKVPQASVKADEKPKPIMKGGSILNSLFKSSPSKAKDAPEIPVAASTQKKNYQTSAYVGCPYAKGYPHKNILSDSEENGRCFHKNGTDTFEGRQQQNQAVPNANG